MTESRNRITIVWALLTLAVAACGETVAPVTVCETTIDSAGVRSGRCYKEGAP